MITYVYICIHSYDTDVYIYIYSAYIGSLLRLYNSNTCVYIYM